MPKRSVPLPGYTVSDEAAAYIADALMNLALQFEAVHLAQIRRYHQSFAAGDPAQLGPSSKRRRSKSG